MYHKAYFIFLFITAILTFSFVTLSFGDEDNKIVAIDNFLLNINIENSIEESIRKIEMIIEIANFQSFSKILKQFPNMKSSEKEELQNIINNQANNLFDGNNKEIAKNKFKNHIANNLNENEISNLKLVLAENDPKIISIISEAAQEMNDYIMNTYMANTLSSEAEQKARIAEFYKKIESNK